MKPFTFSLMLLLQRVDEALSLERQKSVRDPLVVARLRRGRWLVGKRLQRSLLNPAIAGA